MPLAGNVPAAFATVGAAPFELRRLPPPERPAARLTVMDITEYYGPDSGGVRTYLHEKARYVARHADLRQLVILPDGTSRVHSSAGARVYRVRSPRIPFQPTYRVLLDRRAVAAIMAHEAPDVIELGSAYGAPWTMIAAARTHGLPVAWYFHAHLPRIIAPEGKLSSAPRRAAASLAVRYVRAVGRRVNVVLVGSEAVRRDLQSYGIKRVEVVPLGVDTDTFHPSRRSARAETLARLALPDAPIVLYTGRFTAEKQLEVVVRAWSTVRTPDAVLVLAGAGPKSDALRAMASPRVRILPFETDRERLAELYAAADLYLAPGPAETFGLSAHEAMSSGTPVLSVDAGAVADAVRSAGCGGIWPLGNGQAMASMVDELLRSGADASTAARAHVTRRHRWDTGFERLFAIHAGLAARAPA